MGKGLRYFGDFTTPYHPANVTAVDSPGHVKFETYVEKSKDKYKMTTIGNEVPKNFYEDTLRNTNLDNWLTDFSKGWAKKSKQEYYDHASMKHSLDDWNIGATNTMHNSQLGSAGIIYRFLNEVSGKIQNTEDSNVKKIMLSIKTANENKADTTHIISFGLETKQGKCPEWVLNNP